MSYYTWPRLMAQLRRRRWPKLCKPTPLSFGELWQAFENKALSIPKKGMAVDGSFLAI
jgi:hypothetical protein